MTRGFVTRSNEGFWNVVVLEPSTEEFFLYDQSLTNLEDAVGVMKENGIDVIFLPPIRNWMREDLQADNEIFEENFEEDHVVLDKEDLVGWYDLDHDDPYSVYYNHLKNAESR
jgi:hypothetical protein